MPNETPGERRFALILTSYEYADPSLRKLEAPPRDAGGLEKVLKDPRIGGYDGVEAPPNATAREMTQAIERFLLDNRRRDDLLLLYFSGHGVKDEDGRLFLTARDTELSHLESTAVASTFIQRLMNKSKSRSQVLVLDCCYSGAYVTGQTANGDDRVIAGEYFEGRGRAVLMSSNSLEYAFEGEALKTKRTGAEVWSHFTRKLVEGLENGKADADKDGQISADEWYYYARGCLSDENSPQTPQILLQAEDKLFVAANRYWTPGEHEPGTPAADRFDLQQELRQYVLGLIGPTYLLDKSFHLLDWNPAFDELIAKPLGLTRGRYVGAFVRGLVDCGAVIDRSKRVFGGDKPPLVDMEPLVFNSPTYGAVRFHKTASQIPDNEGNLLAWTVHLNVLGADKLDRLWDDVRSRIEQELNWAMYAVSYDRLLLAFPEYLELVRLVVSHVRGARLCIDLGAGTGNGTIELFRDGDAEPGASGEREVWAVEANETMLRHFRAKLRNLERSTNYAARLTLVKEDILRLDGFPKNSFDAAILINALYAVGDREQCLRQVYRVLKPGGVVALSTPHRGTDVNKLFDRMREVLIEQGSFEQLQPSWQSARDRHDALEELIHRDSKEDVRRYLENAGFAIVNEDWRQDHYVDAVIVVKAVKKGGKKSPDRGRQRDPLSPAKPINRP